MKKVLVGILAFGALIGAVFLFLYKRKNFDPREAIRQAYAFKPHWYEGIFKH